MRKTYRTNSSGQIQTELVGSLANLAVNHDGAINVSGTTPNLSNTPLDWKYTTAVTTAYALFVPEHDGTVWGRNATNKIYNFTDPSGSLVISTPEMAYTGEIIFIHPYKEDGVQKIAFVTRDIAGNAVRAYLANSMTDANPTLTLEYTGSITDALCCDAYYDNVINVILIGGYGTGAITPKNLWASYDGGRTYSVIKQTTILGTEMASHFHAVHYDRFSGRIWVAEGDGSNSAINWSDNLGTTWYRDVDHGQPTLIKSFGNGVIFGHDDGFGTYPGLSFWRRDNKGDRDKLTMERVLTINADIAADFYPTSRMWAQRGDTAYILFTCTEHGKDYEYIYATADGGLTWTGVSVTIPSIARIDFLSGITNQGYIVGRHRKSSNPNWLDLKVVYAKVANSQYKDVDVVETNKTVTLATLEAITDTSDHFYSLSKSLTESEIRQIKEIKFSIYDTHTNGSNATASVSLYTSVYALNNEFLSSITGMLYTEISALPDGITSLILSALAGGTGASSGYKVVPALKGLHSNLTIIDPIGYLK